MIRENESPGAGRVLHWWWNHFPEAFRVARNESGVAGFYAYIDAARVSAALRDADALVNGWCEHLRDQPLARGQNAILIRRWLSHGIGEAPSAVQAECWLDVKRTYLEMRASLRRCYLAVSDLAPYSAAAQYLGFTAIPSATARFDGVLHHLAMLDFGPGSLDGWISSLLARELDAPAGDLFDRGARQVVVDGERIDLTSLEFGVMCLLRQYDGKPVSREDLLREVWGQSFDGGSNVVDAVVSSLRQKLGSQAGALATIRGVGYRFGN
ncbi:MAG: winged helix-turn-helix domain-containing protein [Bryobacteraceae bacterium]|nr:winged helix-turn-helix domain-containing protein [Bryobacteraceae bacterium]